MIDDLAQHIPDWLRHLFDVGAILATIGALFQLLPWATSLLMFIWWALRIWETPQVRRWRGLPPLRGSDG